MSDYVAWVIDTALNEWASDQEEIAADKRSQAARYVGRDDREALGLAAEAVELDRQAAIARSHAPLTLTAWARSVGAR